MNTQPPNITWEQNAAPQPLPGQNGNPPPFVPREGVSPILGSPSSNPIVVRRSTAQARMLPTEPQRQSDDREVIIGRSLLTSQRDRKAQTSRERRIAGGLPAWDPAPPGEIVVRRGR